MKPTGINNVAEIGPVRVEHTTPSAYRLCVKKIGEKVLQGAYEWQCGGNHGYEWRDIPEVREE